MLASSWWKSIDLSARYAFVFGCLLILVIVLGTAVYFYNRRRLQKILERNGGFVVKHVDEESLTMREKDAGDLFGIRAIEAGFYGGVIQSPKSSPASTPISTPRAQSPTVWLPVTASGAPAAATSYQPKKITASDSVISLSRFNSNTEINAVSPPRSPQDRSATRFPVNVHMPTGMRLQPSEAEKNGRINHPFFFPQRISRHYPYSPDDVGKPLESPSKFSTTSSEGSVEPHSSSASDISRSTSSSSNTSASSAPDSDASTIAILPAFPAKTAIGRSNRSSDTDRARQRSHKLETSRSQTKARKAIARRSSSAVPQAMETCQAPEVCKACGQAPSSDTVKDANEEETTESPRRSVRFSFKAGPEYISTPDEEVPPMPRPLTTRTPASALKHNSTRALENYLPSSARQKSQLVPITYKPSTDGRSLVFSVPLR